MRLGLSLKLPGLTTWGGYPVPYLFQNGEQGWWWDPSDFSTLYQDAAGTTPVTAVEQPCGLMLDKRLGLVLSSELVTNGDFSTSSNWTAENGWTISGGQAVYTSGGTGRNLTQTINTTAGKFYKVTYTITSGSGAGVFFVGGSAVAAFRTSPGTYSDILSAPSTGATIAIRSSSTSVSFTVDDISVRELPGNHAYTPAAASTARPTVSARVNLLTKTEQFDDAAWTKVDVTVTANAAVAPNGTLTADLLTEGSAGTALTRQDQAIATGVACTELMHLKKNTGADWVRVCIVDPAAAATNFIRAWFDLSNGVKGSQTTGGTAAGASLDIVAAGNGWYQCFVRGSLAGISTYQIFVCSASADASLTRVSNSTYFAWGADLRVANDGVGIPAYQRVNTATDYDSSGFPVYLRADGSNDYLLTNSIDFTGTDKMTLCAGVRKLSDAATGTVMELGTATVNGSIGLFAPLSAAANYEFRSQGTALAQATTSNTFAAPITNVLTALGNISGDSAILRVNGSQAASSTADQGTGNYGNYVLNICSRNQASLFFNGRFYGSVGRGAQSNDQQIAALEGYMNSKTRAY